MPDQNDLFFNTFAAAALKTVRDFCHVDVELSTPYVKGEKAQAPAAIAGILGITSTAANGSVVLCFSKEIFLHIMEKMLGEKKTEITQDIEDAAAELLNIITGQAKAILNKRGFDVHLSIPSVLRGNQVNSSYSKVHTVRVIPFKTSVGEFYLEFLLNKIDVSKIDITKAPADFDSNAAAAKAAFFKPFIDGTLKTMKVQCALECKPLKPYSRQSNNDYSFDFAGIIGVTSRTVNGTFIINFTQDVFLKLISKMFGETVSKFEPGLEDAVCEIANIILGTAKAILNTQGHGVQMAIPTVIYGESIVSSFQYKRPAIVIPFESPIGNFHVEINFTENPAEKAKASPAS